MSLISFEQIEAFKARGGKVGPGAFGENLIVQGFDFKNMPVGTIFKCNEVELGTIHVGDEMFVKEML